MTQQEKLIHTTHTNSLLRARLENEVIMPDGILSRYKISQSQCIFKCPSYSFTLQMTSEEPLTSWRVSALSFNTLGSIGCIICLNLYFIQSW